MSKDKKEDKQQLANASQWFLIWKRFSKHKLAVISLVVLIVMYLGAAFCEFVSPYTPNTRNVRCIQAPPQKIHFFDGAGKFHLRPFVFRSTLKIDDETWQRLYTPDKAKMYPIYLFVKGQEYRFWGLFTTKTHLFGVEAPGYMHLFGTDSLGRDMFSRIIYGSRISLTIGLVGVSLTFLLGIILGGIAGYAGGFLDGCIQRLIEILRCIPQLPLWMALSASLPAEWPPLYIYFGITVILSLLGWTGLARVVRGKFLSLRNEDFIIAAELLGASKFRIIFRHMLPSFMSHIITSATLAVPGMILGETAMSFLGIGLRPPIVSWGVLLQKAQNYQAVALTPWLLLPGVFVIIVVLAFNLVGDGLRDAADPYSSK